MSSPHEQTTSASSTRPAWLIVGHGALASLWAHHLAASGQPLAIITRVKTAPSACFLHSGTPEGGHEPVGGQPQHDANNAAPAETQTLPPTQTLELTIEKHDGALQTRAFNAFDGAALAALIHPNARILVMVKAWQLHDVIEQLDRAIEQANCVPEAIILSHNGIGAAEPLLHIKLNQGWPLYDLVTTHGAWRRHPHHVVHAGAGSALIGPRRPLSHTSCLAPPSWFYLLAAALPPLAWEPDILARRWHKLAINCAINPLATLARQPNGVLLKTEYHADIHAICTEIEAVAALVLGPDSVSATELEAQVHQVIAATQHNTCSMLQDVQRNNPTEIDYLNGYVAKLAAGLGILAPVNQHLANAIKQLTPDA